MGALTTFFNLFKPAKTDGVSVADVNPNWDTIDTELHRPPLTVNGVAPDATTRNLYLEQVPLADNLASDIAQINYGTYIIRTSGGNASIEDGAASLVTIKGNLTRTGYVAESLDMTVTPAQREEGVDPITATIDRDTFVEYVTESGTTTLAYTDAWSADPTDYGITVTGTPISGDIITVVYVKENRGTITVADPTAFNSTGWNLYDSATGTARVVAYSQEYGYKIGGNYSLVDFSPTLSGTRTSVVVTGGYFNVEEDGYLFITGGDATTYIYPTWSDWVTDYNGDFQTYTVDTISLTEAMLNFPYGLCAIGEVRDEININVRRTIQRITRVAYSAENLATVIESGAQYIYDTNYIYSVLAEPVSTPIVIDGTYTVSDHGTEFFSGTTIPVYTEILYGENLKDKLRTDVLTISQQTLTSTQQAQARTNIGAADDSNVIKKDAVDQTIQNSATGVSTTFRVKSTAATNAEAYLRADGEGGNLQLQKGNSTVQLDTYAMSDTSETGYARLYTTKNGGSIKTFQFRQSGQFIDGNGRNLSLLSTTQNVSSSIHVSSTKGTITSKTAYRTGNVVSLSFIYTCNTTVAAKTSLGITATFTDATLKPAHRSPGSSSESTACAININPTTSGADCNAFCSSQINSGAAMWFTYTYVCVS